MFRSLHGQNLLNNLVILVALTISLTAGCDNTVTPGADLEHATTVSPKYLYEITNGEAFHSCGMDDYYYYFRTKEGFFRLTNDCQSKLFDTMRAKKKGLELGFSRLEVVFADENTIVYNKDKPAPNFW